MSKHQYADGIEILGTLSDDFAAVLTPEAINFVAKLDRTFSARREELLHKRAGRQAEIVAGKLPDFLPETAQIRESDWKVAPIPADLLDRRVEITGPVDRKMIINALNSGAKVFMADFEDANSPTWDNTIQGQINLRDAINRRIDYVSPEGKQYRLNDQIATLLVRPRGWHLVEKHLLIDGKPASGSLFDFGLYFFHNVKTLLAKGTGPYFYLPKIESHLEARLWNDVFVLAQNELGIPQGTIRATVLIETILSLGWPQLRALGLYLQLHQEVSQQVRFPAARSRAGDDDHALYALVLAAGNQDVPPPRDSCDRRYVGLHPGEERRRGQRARVRPSARR